MRKSPSARSPSKFAQIVYVAGLSFDRMMKEAGVLKEAEALFADPLADVTADRRRAQRVLSAWARAARGVFPSWVALRKADMRDDWNWVFVVDLAKSVGFPYFVFLGPHLAKLSDMHLAGPVDWTMSILDKAASYINDPAAREEPQIIEDDLVLLDNRTLIFRCLTAPLADDGETVTHIMGVVSGRIGDR